LDIGREIQPAGVVHQCARRRERDDELPPAAVAIEDADRAVGRGVGTRAVVPDGERCRARLTRLGADDAIVPESEDAESHDLFRQMWMRPLVWLALREELVRRARVIDLVEV